MKSPIDHKGKLLAALALGACMISPLTASAQETDKERPDRERESRREARPERQEQAKREAKPERPEQAKREAKPERPEQAKREAKPEAKPDRDKIRGMVGEMMNLKRAGKHEEAAKVASRIRAATGDNPRVEAMIRQAMSGPQGHPQAGPPQGPPHAGPPQAFRRPMGPPTGKPGGMPKPHAGQTAMLPRMKAYHLGLAARHLSAAGYKEQSEMAKKEMEKIIQEARRAQSPPAAGSAELNEEIKKLRKEIDELRAQVRKLNK